MKDFASKALWVFAFVVLVALLFDVPSAYAVAAGKPRWVAWTVGVLAVLVPLAWNIVGERKRAAAAKPGKPSTTRPERIWLRTGFVALVVIGGLFGMARGKAWRAVRNHAFWFVPYSPSALEPSSALFARVPSDAKAIIWLRNTSEASAVLGQVMPVAGKDFEVVAAFDGAKRALVMERGNVGLVDAVAELAQFAGGYAGITMAAPYSLPDGTRVWASPGWGIGTAPPVALVERMRSASADAFLVGVIDDPKRHLSGVAWAGGHDDVLYTTLEATVADEAEAKRLMDEAAGMFDDPATERERACWTDAGGRSSLTHDKGAIHGQASIQASELVELFVCLDRAK